MVKKMERLKADQGHNRHSTDGHDGVGTHGFIVVSPTGNRKEVTDQSATEGA